MKASRCMRLHCGRHGAGFTAVELLIAMAVGLAVAIAAASVLGVTESAKRTTHATADVNQVGAYTAHLLDRWVRSAGTGFAPAATYAYGCRLMASKSSSQILPRPSASALPAPFANVDTGTAGVFRLAPVVIGDGQTTPAVSGAASDVLIVMGGTGGQAEAPMGFSALSQSSALSVTSNVGVSPGDLLLVADRQPSSSGQSDCLVEQVSSSFDNSSDKNAIGLAGSYYAATIGTVSLTAVTSEGVAMVLGNVGGGNAPVFQVIGVGANNTLFSYDLLQTSSDPLQPIADGVFELQALYGVDSDGDGTMDTWVTPTGTWALSALMDGSATAATRLRRIKAIRLGLILRSTVQGGAGTAPSSLTLFSDLGASLTYTRTLSTAERVYRYRTVETTIPVRNNLLLTG